MSGEPKFPAVTYQVGYKRPPATTQFRKGVSGNPRGRPRKDAKAQPRTAAHAELDDILLKEALRPITVRENDQAVEMPMIQAVMRSMGVAAVKGHYKSQLALTHMVKTVQSARYADKKELFQTAIEYKDSWNEHFADCDRRGVPRPEPVPHPDEVVLDMNKLEVRFNGPSTDREKAEWDKLLARRDQALEEVAHYREKLKRKSKYSGIYEMELGYEKRLADMISSMIPDERTRREPDFDIAKWRERQKALEKIRTCRAGHVRQRAT